MTWEQERKDWERLVLLRKTFHEICSSHYSAMRLLGKDLPTPEYILEVKKELELATQRHATYYKGE